jgi:intein-encoded DNA endonuclease-like protein
VVVSQTGWEGTEKEVTELKKEYKKLVKQLNETESEDIRNRLNDLAFLIQDKSEKVTKLKQNRPK